MGFPKKTIKDIDLTGKTVLVRVDYNVPIKNGQITSDYRIQKSLPTIQYLQEQNCRIVLCSHLGRPKGAVDHALSLQPVADHLGTLLGAPVAFVGECIGAEADAAKDQLGPGDVLLLENLRFHPEEESNDADFAQRLAEGMEVFVQDAFGAVHRKHASTSAVTQHVQSVAGLLVAEEVQAITAATQEPRRPLVAIIGGAKIADKIDLLDTFIDTADAVAVGGAMANTFLLAQGIGVGDSLVDRAEVDEAKDILDKAKARRQRDGNFVFYTPQDAVVATKIDSSAKTRIVDWATHTVSDIENYPNKPPRADTEVAKHEKIVDIGPFSGAFIAGLTQLAGSVVWNGAMGITEVTGKQGPVGPFAHGSELVIESLTGQFGNKPYVVVGGGDSAGYLEQRGLADSFDLVSTGGGASMDLMVGKSLPGVEALEDKNQ